VYPKHYGTTDEYREFVKQYRRDIEYQAIARSHRIGQEKPVTVIRFLIKNTVEENIYNDTM
jgi:SNF2 family DNA or RNA helicase